MPPKRSAKSSKHQTEAQSKATVAKPKNVGKSKSEGSKVSSSRGQVKENPNVDKLEGSPAKKPRVSCFFLSLHPMHDEGRVAVNASHTRSAMRLTQLLVEVC